MTDDGQATARSLVFNHVRLCAAFSIIEGALLAVMALSAALVQPGVANAGSALLYVFFAAGCLASPAAVRWVGDRAALVAGCGAYALYVLAYVWPSAATVPPAAALAGLCGAALWTAQGRHLAAAAHAHAAALHVPKGGGGGGAMQAEVDESTQLFSAAFATALPATVAAFKAATALALAATVGGPGPVYALLALCSFGATFLMATVRKVAPPPPPPPAQLTAACDDAGRRETAVAAAASEETSWAEVIRAHTTSPNLARLVLTNVAFGLVTALLPSLATPAAASAVGAPAVGWLYFLANACAAACAAALGTAAAAATPGRRRGVVAAGAAAFAASSLAVALAAPSSPAWGAWPFLVLLFCCYGFGTAVWQCSIMALFARAFPGDARALPAFAALKLHSGLASGLVRASSRCVICVPKT